MTSAGPGIWDSGTFALRRGVIKEVKSSWLLVSSTNFFGLDYKFYDHCYMITTMLDASGLLQKYQQKFGTFKDELLTSVETLTARLMEAESLLSRDNGGLPVKVTQVE